MRIENSGIPYTYLTIIIGKAHDKPSWNTMYKCNLIYIYIVHTYETLRQEWIRKFQMQIYLQLNTLVYVKSTSPLKKAADFM